MIARSRLLSLVLALGFGGTAFARPTLKGPLSGVLQINPETGCATFEGGGHLTLMGKVSTYGEFVFVPGDEPGSLEGIGVVALVAASGDVLVSNVRWAIDPDGHGDLVFRWPGEVTFSDGMVVQSTGRLVELPFAGLKGTSSLSAFDAFVFLASAQMTGEIVDPDPIDT